MVTGASTADAAVILIDARKGVLPQTRRHAYIAHLLGVRHIVVAVNKMDFVGFDETVFERIRKDFLVSCRRWPSQTCASSRFLRCAATSSWSAARA